MSKKSISVRDRLFRAPKGARTHTRLLFLARHGNRRLNEWGGTLNVHGYGYRPNRLHGNRGCEEFLFPALALAFSCSCLTVRPLSTRLKTSLTKLPRSVLIPCRRSLVLPNTEKRQKSPNPANIACAHSRLSVWLEGGVGMGEVASTKEVQLYSNALISIRYICNEPHPTEKR